MFLIYKIKDTKINIAYTLEILEQLILFFHEFCELLLQFFTQLFFLSKSLLQLLELNNRRNNIPKGSDKPGAFADLNTMSRDPANFPISENKKK